MIGRLKRRAEFLQVAAANRKWVAPGLILQVRRQPSPESNSDDAPRAARSEGARAPVRVGFTVSRKVGNAVNRNRMKRRFRALAREVLPERGHPGSDHVMIGRSGGIERDFALLRDDLAKALERARP